MTAFWNVVWVMKRVRPLYITEVRKTDKRAFVYYRSIFSTSVFDCIRILFFYLWSVISTNGPFLIDIPKNSGPKKMYGENERKKKHWTKRSCRSSSSIECEYMRNCSSTLCHSFFVLSTACCNLITNIKVEVVMHYCFTPETINRLIGRWFNWNSQFFSLFGFSSVRKWVCYVDMRLLNG